MDRYLTRDEEARLLRTVKAAAGSDTVRQRIARRDLHLFVLLRHTGIRIGAATHISCADAREALRTHYLQRHGDKGGRDGRTYCNRKAQAALRGLLADRKALGFAEADDAPLMTSRQAPGITPRAVQKRMAHWVAQAGLAVKASPHWWRHTLAMRVMQDSTARDPRGVVQAALDHASIQSSLVYTRPSREQVEQILEEVA